MTGDKTAADTVERDDVRGEPAETRTYLDQVLAHIPVGIAVLDGPDFRYSHINQRLADINGLSVAEHLGKPLAEVLPSAAPDMLPRLRRVRETGAPSPEHEFTTRLPRDPNEIRCFVDALVPVFDADGTVRAVNVIVRDITRRTQAETAPRDALDALREGVQERTTDLSAMNDRLRAEIAERERADADRDEAEAARHRACTVDLEMTPTASVLSVGCGSGILDRHLLETLAGQFDGVRYVGVDPNRAECDRFERTLAHACSNASQIDVHPVAFEDFHTERRFDLIHVIHTLYYLPDQAAAIHRAVELLNPGGQLLILSADADRFNALSRLFWRRLWRRTPWYSSEVRHFLQQSGLAYEVCRLPARLDVTDCFKTASDRGRLLLDFITQVDTATLPEPTQHLVRSYLRAIAEQKDDASFVPHRVTTFRVVSSASTLGVADDWQAPRVAAERLAA